MIRQLQVQCCVCQRVRRGERWVQILPAPGEMCSHGYCPECARLFRAQVQAYLERQLMREIAS